MGQRTQVILQKVNNQGKKDNKVYHFQWGFGRTMFLQLMDLFITDYFKDTWEKSYSFFEDIVLKERATDITQEVDFPKNFDASDIEQVKSIINQCHNNNGCMVIQLFESERQYETSNFKIGLLLGSESLLDINTNEYTEEPLSRFVSVEEYWDKEGGEFARDVNFQNMFKSFIQFAGIEILK